jgi:hypothetical protein
LVPPGRCLRNSSLRGLGGEDEQLRHTDRVSHAVVLVFSARLALKRFKASQSVPQLAAPPRLPWPGIRLDTVPTRPTIRGMVDSPDPTMRKKVHAGELEALIMQRLWEHPDCAGITQVYVRATGRVPPEETWVHTLVSRRPTVPRTHLETTAMHAVLNEMRKEFDLAPD